MRIVFPLLSNVHHKSRPILCLNKAFVNFCCLLSIDHLSLTGSLTLHIRQSETEIPRAAFPRSCCPCLFDVHSAQNSQHHKVTAAGTQPSSALIVAMVACRLGRQRLVEARHVQRKRQKLRRARLGQLCRQVIAC